MKYLEIVPSYFMTNSIIYNDSTLWNTHVDNVFRTKLDYSREQFVIEIISTYTLKDRPTNRSPN